MFNKFLSFLAASFALTGAVSAAERVESYEWLVGDAPIIKVEAFKGTIRVEPAESGKVELSLEAQASGRNAERWLERLTVKASPFGAGLVTAVKRASWGVEFTTDHLPMRDITLVLRVPQPCTLDLKTGFGHIEVANEFRGNTRARVSTGDIFIGRVDGSVNAVTQSGNVIISRASGDVTARSHLGDLQVGNVKGQANLRADHGNIDVVNSVGGLKAKSVNGNITAGMSLEISGDTHLEAAVGDVFVAIDPDSFLDVRARTTWGKVNSALDLQGVDAKSGDSQLRGLLNGGGALMALLAKGGDVHIKSVPTYGMYFD